MAFVNIGIKGLNEANKFLSRLDSSFKKEVKAELKFAAEEVAAFIKRDAPVDTSRLKNSVSVKQKTGLSVEIVAQSNNAPYMEFGTKKHFKAPAGLETYASQFRGQKGSGQTNPIEALTRWVRRKGLADTYSTQRYDVNTRAGVRRSRGKEYKKRESTIAFLIFRKIKRDGVKPQPFFFTNKSGINRTAQATKIITERLVSALKRIKNA